MKLVFRGGPKLSPVPLIVRKATADKMDPLDEMWEAGEVASLFPLLNNTHTILAKHLTKGILRNNVMIVAFYLPDMTPPTRRKIKLSSAHLAVA